MQIEQSFNGRVHQTDWTIPAGESKVFTFATPREAVVVVHALGVGVSANVFFSATSTDSVKAGDEPRFTPAKGIGEAGVVTNGSSFAELQVPINYLKVEAVGGAVTVEILQ